MTMPWTCSAFTASAGCSAAVLTGVFALESVGGASGALDGNVRQIWVQFEGVVAVAAWSAIGTAVILYALKLFMNLRVSEEDEAEGLDYSQHGEAIGADG